MNSIIRLIISILPIYLLLFLLAFTIFPSFEQLNHIFLYVKTEKVNKSLTSKNSFDVSSFHSTSNFAIYIPNINIDSTITSNVDVFNYGQYMANLKKGPVQYRSLPGNGSNIFIYGHSNLPWGDTNENKAVFNGLTNLNLNDKIYLEYHQKIFTYLVFNKEIVNDDDLSILQPTSNEIVTLMTCWPLGINYERLIIQAKLIIKTN